MKEDVDKIWRLQERVLELESILFSLKDELTLRDERDEARAVSAGLLSHLEVAWAASREMAQVIEAQRQEVTHAVKRFYPWLKEQPTVDERKDTG